MFEILKTWSREVPREWETALRDFSPIVAHSTWLALRWFPRSMDTALALKLGVSPGTDCGRFVMHECVPETVIRDDDAFGQSVLAALRLEKPSTLCDDHDKNHERRARRIARERFVNDYQWEMYRQYRVWARELWILQGDSGGHATRYEPEEQKLMQLHGLPTDPPALGELPYAPFDGRVIAQLQRRNRLIKFGNDLHALRSSGSAQALDAEFKATEKAYRAQYLAFLREQSQSRADLTTWFTSKSDHRDILPAASADEIRAAARFEETFIDTGAVPA